LNSNFTDEQWNDLLPHDRARLANSDKTDDEILANFNSRRLNQPFIDDPLSYFTADGTTGILLALYFGADIDIALRSVGIPYGIYLSWRNVALQTEGIVRNFFSMIEVAIAEFELIHLKNLALHSSVDSKASQFVLERLRSERFAPRSFITNDSELAYMTDLEGLVSSGAVTVAQLKEELTELNEIQVTYLLGVQSRRTLLLEESDKRAKKQYTVRAK